MVFENSADSTLVNVLGLALCLSGSYHVLSGPLSILSGFGGATSVALFGFLSLVLGILLIVTSLGFMFRGGSDWFVGTAGSIIFLVLVDILGIMMFSSLLLVADLLLLFLGFLVLLKHYSSSAATSARSGMEKDDNVHSVGRDYP